MEEDLILKLMSNVGVPAVLAFVMIYRVSPAIDKLTAAINQLNSDIEKRLSQLEREYIELKHRLDVRRG